MKAIVRSIEKKCLPHPYLRDGKEVSQDTLKVVAEVDFQTDDGKLIHTQKYAHLPTEIDPQYYRRQADVMQADLDLARQWNEAAVQKQADEQPADEAIQRLHLELGDSLQIKDGAKHE